jgi:predicted TIM-barrel fold metal-dependent hydrolase
VPPLFDAHFHVIDARFPLVANQGYVPASFTVSDYRDATADLEIRGGAVVSGSFQGLDTTYLEAALGALGEGFVGVVQLPVDVADAEVRRLDLLGVRAVRANVYRTGPDALDVAVALARRVDDLVGWHLEVYADAATVDATRLVELRAVVLDHLGLSAAGLPRLLEMVAAGVMVKAAGFGRIDPDLDVATTLRRIADVDPRALLFGTDLPATRARRPFRRSDLELLEDAVGVEAAAMATWENALARYRPQQGDGAART